MTTIDSHIATLTADLAAANLAPQAGAELHVKRGNDYHSEGKEDLAIADCSEAIRLAPQYVAGYNCRGNAHVAQGLFADAVADYSYALDLNPDYVPALNNRGNTYLFENDNQRALADFDRALRFKADDYRIHFNRADALLALGRFEEAAAGFDRVTQFPAADKSAYFFKGQALYLSGDYAGAADSLSRSLAFSPNDSRAIVWQYLASRKLGVDGLRLIETSAAASTDRNWPYPALAFFMGGRSTEELLDAARAVGGRSPADAECMAWTYIAEQALMSAKTTEARVALRKALGLCGDHFPEASLAKTELGRLDAAR